MSLGDYQVGDDLLFERKTLRDFAASICDGRLFGQSRRLVAAPLKAVCVLEGRTSDLERCGMTREAMQGALISMSVVFGIPVLRSMNPEETACLICYTSRQITRSRGGVYRKSGPRTSTKRRIQMHVLQGLPGIGPERAERLLGSLGSIENIVLADEEKLARIPGIGCKTAAAMRRVFQ